MAKQAIPWLGIQSPFGGLRVIARSGQGLMGMAEEFDELLAKILKDELQEGICDKIVDDVVIGGKTPEKPLKITPEFWKNSTMQTLKSRQRRPKYSHSPQTCLVGYGNKGGSLKPHLTDK